jgi:hypothetical protein
MPTSQTNSVSHLLASCFVVALIAPGAASVARAQAQNSASPQQDASPSPASDATPPLAVLLKQYRDIPAAGQSGTPGSEPPSTDRHNLSGVWRPTVGHMILKPESGAREDGLAPYNATGEKIFIRNMAMNLKGTPVASPTIYCWPQGVVYKTGFPATFRNMQSPDRIVQFFVDNDVRTIHMNRPHPKNLKPTYMGDSTGHWEGDTLVVDTIGFNGRPWLDLSASPSSDKLHVVERITKAADGSSYEDVETIDDPGYYTQPFTLKNKYLWNPESKGAEMHCEDNPRWVVVHGLIKYAQ